MIRRWARTIVRPPTSTDGLTINSETEAQMARGMLDKCIEDPLGGRLVGEGGAQ